MAGSSFNFTFNLSIGQLGVFPFQIVHAIEAVVQDKVNIVVFKLGFKINSIVSVVDHLDQQVSAGKSS